MKPKIRIEVTQMAICNAARRVFDDSTMTFYDIF